MLKINTEYHIWRFLHNFSRKKNGLVNPTQAQFGRFAELNIGNPSTPLVANQFGSFAELQNAVSVLQGDVIDIFHILELYYKKFGRLEKQK